MKKYITYFKYVVRHKLYVFKAGLKLKAPLWKLIIHDWSKFLPSEFFPYAEWFYGWNGKSWYDAPKDDPQKELQQKSFDLAWNYHQKRNPHHYQFWTVINDKGDIKSLEMPEEYVREMVADWIGAGMAINGKNDVKDWYLKNRDAIKLHKNSRELVCKLIGIDYSN